MTSGLVLLLVVVGGYLAAHLAAEWLARRHLIISGAEYLLLGVLLGPEVAGIIRPSTVDGFTPFLTLALGWIGALVGAQFFLPELLRIRANHYRIAFAEALLAFGIMAAGSMVLLTWQFGVTLEEALVPAVVLGAIGAASAPTGIALVSREVGPSSPVIRQLQVTTAVDALVAVTAFGVLLAMAHPGPPPGQVRPPTATEWVVLSVAIGIGGGTLFHLFLGPEQKIDRLFIALAGALILTSGAAAYLDLSPLLPSMLVGMVLVNTSRSRDAIRQALGKVERPLYFVLLIFAGAAWRPGAWGWILVVVAFLLLRLVTKVGMARLIARATGTLDALGPEWGRGLLGHGGLALAIGLSYWLLEPGGWANLVFTATIVSVLFTDVISARLVRTVVLDYADRMRRATLLRRSRREEA